MESSEVKTPFVSVVMPVKNAENTVKEAVDSILSQTTDNFELIVIDDSSTDSTRSIIDDHYKIDGRVIVRSNDGKGICDARNLGLEIARAPLYAVMDADDIADQHRLKLQYEAFERNQNLVLLGSFYHVFEGNINNLKSTITLPVENDKLKSSMQLLPTFGHPTVMAKTAAMRKIGGYRKPFEGAEDHDLYLRLSDLGDLGVLPEFLMYYRSHSQQFSRVKKAMGYRASVAAVYCSQRVRENSLEYGHPKKPPSDLAVEFLEYSAEVQEPMTKQRVNLCVRAVKGLGILPEYLEKLLMIRRKIAIKLIKSMQFKLAIKFWQATRKSEWLDQ